MSIDRVLRANLTPEQYDAATDRADEVLCLACAGSGKSRTLAYRISRLIAEGEPADSIVAFTFTVKAAEAIKRRVSTALAASGIDPTVMGAMYIGTIDAYCQRALGEIDARFRQFDVLDENRLKLYLMSRFYDLGLRNLRGARYFDIVGSVANAWKTANDELLDLNAIAAEDPTIGDVLLRLRSRLAVDQFSDFSLTIRNLVDALRSNAPGLEAAIGRLRHLMVDEYQDTNACQEELIRLLHRRSRTLFVVGDDDQAIYGWRGADVTNIIEFDQRYPNCRSYTLAQNFRSTTPIVQSTDAFASAELGASRIGKNPWASANLTPQHIGVMPFAARRNEAEWVADRIATLMGSAYDDNGVIRGLTPADFAVLMRSTRQPEQDGAPRHLAFTAALSARGIPYSLEAGGAPFDRPQTAVLRSTFNLLRDGTPDRATVASHFSAEVVPAYPDANFNALVRVLTDWGRRIHRPQGTTRLRLYPQALVYDLLESFGTAASGFGDEVMRDIGLFSRMMLDVETVYMSVDSRSRFAEILNFLANIAENGYDVSTDDVQQRPDAVTVSTVHKMKGLEFPCVFVVDVEASRFPKRRSTYNGWLPAGEMAVALRRGAYQSTLDEECRLFYTACTRAERYLYVSAAMDLPAAKQAARLSPFAQRIASHPSAIQDPNLLPQGLGPAPPRRRVEDADYPTSFTEIRYYLQCPRGYQYRERYGLSPAVPEMFGYGRTVHTSIEKLHERFPSSTPTPDEATTTVRDTFHLKHVPQSNDPVNRPGAYENARARAESIARDYVSSFGEDFARSRQVEAAFEIPAANCVISGSIDLLLREDENGAVLDAEIIDFKSMEGGEDPNANPELDWTELALQVQLYAAAASQVLGENARTGNVHLLKDNQRVQVPVTAEAVDAARENIEWAVAGILASDFPMRPHATKCGRCDFVRICPRSLQAFRQGAGDPPALYLPDRREMVRAFSLCTTPTDAG